MLVKLLTTRAKRAIQDSLTFTLPKVKVRVNQGIVQGCVEKLPNGSTFQRFSGIPYAKPPVNELRFRSPQVLLKFDQDVVDCTRERDASFHKSGFLKKYIGSEDCLNLNVYAPSTATPTQKLPVMVFIHGGGLAFDSNSRDFYSPEYLLMEDVIVVTINYRLHAFGFSCLPSVGISGNAGLKDQQLALQWIHENISNFNGDPENICLFGESAGAACVHLHAFNDKSKKLIKSAICQSNYALADWFFQKDGPGRTRHMAKVIGATGNSDEDVLNALMQASPQQLCDSNVKCGESDMLRRNLPFVFKAVVEQESDDAFLTTNPLEMIKTQKLDVPIIFGVNDGDGMTMGNYYRKKLPLFDKDYVRMVPLSLNTDPDSEEAKHIGKAIKQFYFGDKHIDESTLSEFVDLMTDFHFTIPMLMSNELHARYQKKSKQFVFEFCYDGELNMFKKLLKMTDVKGACHFDELFYLFDAKMIGMEVAKDSPAWNMRKTMCKLWTNFAKYQNPTPDNDNPLSIKWNPIKSIPDDTTTFDIDYLRIGDKFEMKSNLYSERVSFWRKLYEKHNSSFINPKF